MDTEQQNGGTAGRCLTEALTALGQAGAERRHEALMEWAETDLGLDREYAEQVYALAEEEELEPIIAFHVVRCGIGVIELAEPEQDADDGSTQQAPPEWVGTEAVELDDVVLERRLRATFRRLRASLSDATSVAAGVESFLSEPDVAPVRLR